MNRQVKGVGLTLLSAIIFGLNPLFAKDIYAAGGNAMTFSLARMLLGSIGMLAIHAIFEKGGIGLTRRQLLHVTVCSVGYCLTPVFLYLSYDYLYSGIASTLHFIYPVLVFIACVALHDEPFHRGKLVCCVMCAVGISCFCVLDGTISVRGILYASLSGVTYAFYAIYLVRSGLRELKAYQLGFWLCLISTVMIGALILLSGQLALPTSGRGMSMMVIGGLLSACVATISFQEGAFLIGAQSASLLSTFEPVTATLIGFFVYREALAPRAVLGIVLILIATAVLSAIDLRAARRGEAHEKNQMREPGEEL